MRTDDGADGGEFTRNHGHRIILRTIVDDPHITHAIRESSGNRLQTRTQQVAGIIIYNDDSNTMHTQFLLLLCVYYHTTLTQEGTRHASASERRVY